MKLQDKVEAKKQKRPMSVSSARRSDLTRVSTEHAASIQQQSSPKRTSPKSKIKFRNSATVRRNGPAGDDKAYFRNVGGVGSKRNLQTKQ